MVTRPVSAKDDGRLLLVVNAARKDVDYAHIAARLPGNVTLTLADRPRAAGLAGAGRRVVMAKLSDDAAKLQFMHVGSGEGRRLRLPRFAVRATPARTASRFRWRRIRRRTSPGCCWRSRTCSRSASARATRCGWRRASACTATTSTRRPAPSRPVSPGRSRSGGGRKAASRASSASATSLARGPAPQARRHQAGGTGAGARGHRDSSHCWASASASSPRAASGRASTARSPWATCSPTTPAPGTSVNLMVRGKALAASVVPLPFLPHRYARKS